VDPTERGPGLPKDFSGDRVGHAFQAFGLEAEDFLGEGGLAG
jgi:hypothetical protein